MCSVSQPSKIRVRPCSSLACWRRFQPSLSASCSHSASRASGSILKRTWDRHCSSPSPHPWGGAQQGCGDPHARQPHHRACLWIPGRLHGRIGLAPLENILYISSAAVQGPTAFSFTAVIRGVGSIPGHAVWTALTGASIGAWLQAHPSFLAPASAWLGLRATVDVVEER